MAIVRAAVRDTLRLGKQSISQQFITTILVPSTVNDKGRFPILSLEKFALRYSKVYSFNYDIWICTTWANFTQPSKKLSVFNIWQKLINTKFDTSLTQVKLPTR